MLQRVVFFAVFILLSGCELLPVPDVKQPIQTESNECVFVTSTDAISTSWLMKSNAPECKMSFWLDIWSTASTAPWRERKVSIEQLGQTPDNELHKYILSQPIDTPYQVRLRAQNAFNSIRPYLQEDALSLFEQIAYMPSQQLLEYESAITILSQVNTRQAKRNEEQAQLLLEQEEKINQLLNLEASILEKNLER